MVARVLVCLAALLVCAAIPDSAEAAKKRKRNSGGQIVAPAELFTAEVTIKVDGKKKKKNKRVNVQCLGTVSGQTKQTPNGLMFTSYASMAKKAAKRGSAKAVYYNKLKKAGPKGCVRPNFTSLSPYTGPFTAREAHILFNRFAFGGSPADIARAVAEGLDATVNRLTTFVPEQGLTNEVADLECDARFAVDPFTGDPDVNNEQCSPTDPNDYSITGLRRGWYWLVQGTQNRFHEKLAFFIGDERAAFNVSNLPGQLRYAARNYWNAVRGAAIGGDYKQFVRNMTLNFGTREGLSMFYLDNGTNHYPNNINENWAREILELQTMGATGITGTPNYNDFDIANVALALSGFEFDDRNGVRESGYFESRHAPGLKPLFGGTPYAAVVDTPQQLVEALLADARTWEHLAEDIWKQFVGPTATPAALRELAKLLEDNNGNLIPVFRTLMRSRAVYANENANALIKHSVDLVFGFINHNGMKLTPSEIESALSALGQEVMRPNTVFGWDERKDAGDEFRQLAWRNRVISLIQYGESTLEDRGYSYWDRYVAPLQGTAFPSLGLIDKLSNEFGVALNEAQRSALDQYLNYNLVSCSSGPTCVNGKRLNLDVFTAVPQSEGGNNDGETRGAVGIIAMLPAYRMK